MPVCLPEKDMMFLRPLAIAEGLIIVKNSNEWIAHCNLILTALDLW
jgi:hypothetical protein